MPSLTTPLTALLDLLAPERCVLCGADRGLVPWSPRGPRVPGLRPWDEPHLCRDCGTRLGAPPPVRLTAAVAGCPPLAAARHVDADLVAAVGAWKYHGLRGLAWPLARLLAAARRTLPAGLDGRALLVPIPLHRRRRRRRGFNQAALLALLLAAGRDDAVATGVLTRRRRTPQQAKVLADADRCRNLAGAFAALPAPPEAPPLLLVDDIVTSGATLAAAAAALRERGWAVPAAMALGARLPGPVDRSGGAI